MKKLIELEPVHQTGHNCKPVAIAAVENYFAALVGFEPIIKSCKSAPQVSGPT